MTSAIYGHGPDEGRAYIICDGCGKHFTAGSYVFARTRQKAMKSGWDAATYADRTDWCADCVRPKPVDASLFDLMNMESTT